jgi:3-oxoacyl-[acyl-carrier protein] reductase
VWAAASVVKVIAGSGRKTIAIQADAADAKAVKDAVEKTVAALGGLHVLVNNAGTAIPKKHLKSGGRIITIGPCLGERMLTPGLVPYSATKGAVKMFTRGLERGRGRVAGGICGEPGGFLHYRCESDRRRRNQRVRLPAASTAQ